MSSVVQLKYLTKHLQTAYSPQWAFTGGVAMSLYLAEKGVKRKIHDIDIIYWGSKPKYPVNIDMSVDLFSHDENFGSTGMTFGEESRKRVRLIKRNPLISLEDLIASKLRVEGHSEDLRKHYWDGLSLWCLYRDVIDREYISRRLESRYKDTVVDARTALRLPVNGKTNTARSFKAVYGFELTREIFERINKKDNPLEFMKIASLGASFVSPTEAPYILDRLLSESFDRAKIHINALNTARKIRDYSIRAEVNKRLFSLQNPFITAIVASLPTTQKISLLTLEEIFTLAEKSGKNPPEIFRTFYNRFPDAMQKLYPQLVRLLN